MPVDNILTNDDSLKSMQRGGHEYWGQSPSSFRKCHGLLTYRQGHDTGPMA